MHCNTVNKTRIMQNRERNIENAVHTNNNSNNFHTLQKWAENALI